MYWIHFIYYYNSFEWFYMNDMKATESQTDATDTQMKVLMVSLMFYVLNKHLLLWIWVFYMQLELTGAQTELLMICFMFYEWIFHTVSRCAVMMKRVTWPAHVHTWRRFISESLQTLSLPMIMSCVCECSRHFIWKMCWILSLMCLWGDRMRFPIILCACTW